MTQKQMVNAMPRAMPISYTQKKTTTTKNNTTTNKHQLKLNNEDTNKTMDVVHTHPRTPPSRDSTHLAYLTSNIPNAMPTPPTIAKFASRKALRELSQLAL